MLSWGSRGSWFESQRKAQDLKTGVAWLGMTRLFALFGALPDHCWVLQVVNGTQDDNFTPVVVGQIRWYSHTLYIMQVAHQN